LKVKVNWNSEAKAKMTENTTIDLLLFIGN
jgi:hypothetical protein